MNEMQTEYFLPKGTLLFNGKYRIEAYLASGGFGNTYLATDTSFNEQVAIKELFVKGICGRNASTGEVSVSLSENRISFEAHREKFRKEARRIRKLNSPHVVKVRDLFDDNDTSYYVMDFIDGESLSARLNRLQRPLTEAEVGRLLPQVLDGLRSLHAEHIWHLDLKPANIMVDRQDRVLLIDFGSSKQLQTAEGVSLSTSSAMAYTQGYAPPEQMDQLFERFGPWTDLYALGATLFHLLTRQRPPSASDILDNAEAALAMPGVSSSMQQLVRWLMTPARNGRPQSVEEVRAYWDEQTETTQGTLNSSSSDTKQEALLSNDETMIRSKGEHVDDAISEHSVPKPDVTKKAKIIRRWFYLFMVALCLLTGIFVIRSLSSKPEEQAELDKLTGTANNPDEQVEFDKLTANMVYVPGGTFTMGATSEQGVDVENDEYPTHSVIISSFYICKYEVTQALWKAVMGNNPSCWEGDNLPVENVSWEDCQEFILELNAMTGKNFRLPTEAEWEFAARGGNNSRGYKYAGSNDISTVAWYGDNSGEKTHVVGTKSPNELGLYDMSGNVWEWCQDWYGDYSSASQTNPTGASSGSDRVLRGGCWDDGARYCRSSLRGYCAPDDRGCNDGLRLVLSQL